MSYAGRSKPSKRKNLRRALLEKVPVEVMVFLEACKSVNIQQVQTCVLKLPMHMFRKVIEVTNHKGTFYLHRKIFKRCSQPVQETLARNSKMLEEYLERDKTQTNKTQTNSFCGLKLCRLTVLTILIRMV